MTTNIGPYLLAICAMASIVIVILYGDPTRAAAWFPIFASLAAAIPGIIAVFQIRDQATKIEAVHQEVNGKQQQQIDTAYGAAYTRGKVDAVNEITPLVREAVSTERATLAVDALERVSAVAVPPGE